MPTKKHLTEKKGSLDMISGVPMTARDAWTSDENLICHFRQLFDRSVPDILLKVSVSL
jgi:hypothetical protein